VISNIVGNFAAYVIFSKLSQTSLFTIFTIVAAVGVVAFLLLRNLPPIPAAAAAAAFVAQADGGEEAESEDLAAAAGDAEQHQQRLYDAELSASHSHGGGLTADNAALLPLMKKVWRLLKGRSMLLVCPMFVWTGIELAFWNGEYTQLLDQSVIGLVMLWVGVAEVLHVSNRFSHLVR
jgi:hypothetical protein